MIIYGIRFARTSNSTASSAQVANKVSALTLVALDLAKNQIASTSEVQPPTVEAVQEEANSQQAQAMFTTPTERITGITAQNEHSFVVSVVTTTSRGYFSQLLFLDRQAPQAKKVSGFKASNHTVEGLVAIPSGAKNYELLSSFSFNGGIPPFDLGKIDPRTGKVQFGAAAGLPEPQQNQRMSNLVRSKEGAIYATVLSGGATQSESATPTLVRLNLTQPSVVTGRGTITQVAQLQIDNQWLQSDLLGLAVAPSGQLFALANPNYEETNSLFTVDVNTGEMKFLRKFEVDKITFTHS